VARGLDRLEACAADGTLRGDEVNLATISTACAIAYLNFRRVAPGWCATRPQLVKLVDALFQRQLCAYRTAADLTQQVTVCAGGVTIAADLLTPSPVGRGKITYRQAHS
jgi:glutathione S-transferase